MARRLAAGTLAVAAVVGHAQFADAATAVEAGWWTASPVVAPDAPPDALVVQGGIAGPLSYGAVGYRLAPAEIPETLTLRLADGAASIPGTGLMLCLLTEPFTPAQGGPIEDAPAFDCDTAAEASPSTDGATYRFDVAELARGGALAVAVLPTAPTDRVVLAAPGVDSLATADSSAAAPDAHGPPATAVTSDPASPTASATSGSRRAPRTPQPVAAVPAAPPRATPEAAAAPPRAAPPSMVAAPAARDGGPSRGSWVPPALFVGLAVVAARLWLRGGAGDDLVGARPA